MNVFRTGLSAFRLANLRSEFHQLPKSSNGVLNILRHSSSNTGNNPGGPTKTPSSTSETYHTAAAQVQSNSYIESKGQNLPEISRIPLSQEVKWIPQPIYSTASESDTLTRVTTLSNGIRVASEPKFGNFCTIGVLFDSGSRYEVAYPSGISHFLEKLAFGDAMNMNREYIQDTFEKVGGICDCQTLRDVVIYAASVETTGLERVMQVLSEVVWRPLITQPEFEMAQMAISFDLENIDTRPEKDALMFELIHKAAYRLNTVGLPKICPPANVAGIKVPHIMSYLKHHHSPDRMVIAGVGVDHDKLVGYVEKFFPDGSAIWDQKPELLHPQTAQCEVDTSVAQYTGGASLESADLSNVSLGVNPLPELCHLMIGLESVSHLHDDFVACCVLNTLMGGGGSFSSGGPGKGMYTRLYTNVLNRHHWMHSAIAHNYAYSDTGLFSILAAAHPSRLHQLTEVVTRELVAMTSTIKMDELKRAKSQLQSMIMMNLESRPVVFEDMARQVMATGERKPPHHFIDLISKISLDDVHRVASNMLKSKLSVAAYGTLDNLPPVEDIQEALTEKKGRLRSRAPMFPFGY